MKEMINFGIDLGTSNSLIAKFSSGRVEVFKNPKGHKECLPSVVGFRKDKILVGDSAQTYAEKDPKNVASRFKRKMGTTETIKIESLDTSKTPVELSAFVLKELKSFVQSGEKIDSVVITIPTSFDTVQSNATKKAGLQAGFKNVILLQEPIAASLAYANKDNKLKDLKNSQWIVYDLGGGTFDVALVRITEGELIIVDHEGNNFFGGTDFDAMIVENIFIPALESKGKFHNLLAEMKSAKGRYNREWFILLHAAERLKIELTSDQSTDVLFEDLSIKIKDDVGNVIDLSITITRSELEALIKDKVAETTQMMKKILTRQSLQPRDLKFVLMVGGSTYIPFVRRYVEEIMGIPVNTDIDPTNAIVQGAAFYAGNKPQRNEKITLGTIKNYKIKVRTSYERNSQEKDEMFSAKIEGDITGMTYRIYRQDGGFDSGTKILKNRFTEDLPLREGEYNLFQFQIRDPQGNVVVTDDERIQISQGHYSIAGQLLPDELSLVMDNLKNKDTRLEPIFNKNCVLPTRAKKTVEAAKTVVQGSDDRLFIMVVEGSSKNHYLSNKKIGVIEISGTMINKDLLKGTEIDITFDLSEARDLSVSAYLNGTGQDFSDIFNPKNRDVKLKELSTDILHLETMILTEQKQSVENNNHETTRNLKKVLEGVQSLIMESGYLSEDDVTEKKFQIEDKKCALANELYQLTSGKRINKLLAEYQEMKNSTIELVQEHGNDREQHMVKEITGREQVFFYTNNPATIEAEINGFQSIKHQILIRIPEFLVNMFEHLVANRISMNDQQLVQQLLENGKRCIKDESWEDLHIVNYRLWNLMPDREKEVEEYRFITGIIS